MAQLFKRLADAALARVFANAKDSDQVGKIVRGALIAAAGAALAYLLPVVGVLIPAPFVPAATAILSFLVNAVRKLAEDK